MSPSARRASVATKPVPAQSTRLADLVDAPLIDDEAPEKPSRLSLTARAERIASTEIAFIDNPDFADTSAAARILIPNSEVQQPTTPIPSGLPPYFAALYATPLLSASEEADLFRRMNYLKYLVLSKRGQLNLDRPHRKQIEEIEALHTEAQRVRDKLVHSNLRLVVSIARKLVSDYYSFDDIVGDGNLLLLRAIEKFDYARGFKFNTYATHVIRRELNRKSKMRRQQAKRVAAELDERLTNTPDVREATDLQSNLWDRWPRLLALMGQILDDREQTILAMRLGLDLDQGPQNRKSIGERLGISTERVRQLEMRAIARLKAAASE